MNKLSFVYRKRKKVKLQKVLWFSTKCESFPDESYEQWLSSALLIQATCGYIILVEQSVTCIPKCKLTLMKQSAQFIHKICWHIKKI